MSGSARTRVVIAEDEAIIRLDLKELLEEEGYEVVGQTGRGDEAVDLVRELRPDAAILDMAQAVGELGAPSTGIDLSQICRYRKGTGGPDLA